MNSHDTDSPTPEPLPSQSVAAAPKPRRRKPKPVASPVEAGTVPVGEVDIIAAAPEPAVVLERSERDVRAAARTVPEHEPSPLEDRPMADGIRRPPPEGEGAFGGSPSSTQETGVPGGPVSSASDGMEAADGARRPRNRRRGRRGERDRSAAEAGPQHDRGLGDAVDEGGPRPDGRPPRPALQQPTLLVDAAETFADVLSGAYDALDPTDAPVESQPSSSAADAGAPPLPVSDPGVTSAPTVETATGAGADVSNFERRVLAAEPDAPKLHKLLAQSGIGSRRDMEQLIEDGQVTVNDQVAHVGQRISFGDQVRVSGRLVKLRIAPPLARVLAYHKPVGEVVTNDDPQNRPTVFRRLPRLPHGKWQSVGRLDINTEGLLLFTNSGDLANQLMHPRFGVEREYAVRVLGSLDAETRAKLIEGVEIDGQRAAFRSIDDGGGEGVNHWYRVVITEGRNREVRKLFDRVGLGVSRLIRIRYGCVVLPRGLKRGVFVDLNEHEVRELRRLAGGRDKPPVRRDAAEAQGPGHGRKNRRRGSDNRGPERVGERAVERQGDRAVDSRDERHEGMDDHVGPIPNPLQQTFDKRAIREARQPRREYSEDGPIPNPLEQTYDRRFVQKARGPGDGRGKRGGDQGGAQPDPMKTSLGYIGADAFVRKFQGGGGGGGGGRGGRRRGGR